MSILKYFPSPGSLRQGISLNSPWHKGRRDNHCSRRGGMQNNIKRKGVSHPKQPSTLKQLIPLTSLWKKCCRKNLESSDLKCVVK